MSFYFALALHCSYLGSSRDFARHSLEKVSSHEWKRARICRFSTFNLFSGLFWYTRILCFYLKRMPVLFAFDAFALFFFRSPFTLWRFGFLLVDARSFVSMRDNMPSFIHLPWDKKISIPDTAFYPFPSTPVTNPFLSICCACTLVSNRKQNDAKNRKTDPIWRRKKCQNKN